MILTATVPYDHTMCMKRTNLVLDEHILEKARSISGIKTYSEVVNIALAEFVRRKTFARIDNYASSDIWEGSVAEMRGDFRVSD